MAIKTVNDVAVIQWLFKTGLNEDDVVSLDVTVVFRLETDISTNHDYEDEETFGFTVTSFTLSETETGKLDVAFDDLENDMWEDAFSVQ